MFIEAMNGSSNDEQWVAWSHAYVGGGTTDIAACNKDIKISDWNQERVVENDYFRLTCVNGNPTQSVTVTVKKACTVLKEVWDVSTQSAAISYTPTTDTIVLTQDQVLTLNRVSDIFVMKLTVQ